VTAAQILPQIIEQVIVQRPLPKMMVRIADRQLGIEWRF
jgi:hypothetical protein